MVYKLIITEEAEELLDRIIFHLLYRIKNEQAATHLLDGINEIYNRLEDNPNQFPICKDQYLVHKGYKEAVVPDMNYLLIFKVEENRVYIMGVFHELEDYENKL
ncbi:MAG: type II toxin-antitoxin system RelE/ParE family toxin [Lachnospiraceae bacterium]